MNTTGDDAADRDRRELELRAQVAALEIAANHILLELAYTRGKGPWFPGFLNRIQSAALECHAPKGTDEAGKETWGNTVHGTVYETFRRVLMNPTVPDFRHDAAVSGAGHAHRILAPAVAAGYRIVAELALDPKYSAIDHGALDLLEAEAVRQAKLQSVPSDAQGVLKERWISASIAAIDHVLAGKRRTNE